MKVRHAWQNPRVKANHIPVLRRVLSIRERIAKTLDFADSNDIQSVAVDVIEGWLQDIDDLNIQACLKGEFKRGKASKGKKVKKLKKPSTKEEIKAS